MSDIPKEITKLPVWRTVKAAYLVIFHNPLLAVKLGFFPLFILLFQAILTGYFWGGMPAVEIMSATNDNIGMFLLMYGLGIFSYLATIPMITAWHRMVILGHADPNSRIEYSIRRNEWQYLWKAILFGLLIALFYFFFSLMLILAGAVIAAIINSATQVTPNVNIIIVLTVSLLSFFVTGFILRLSLVFPAAAVGKPIGFRESWKQSRGNTWRLFAAVGLSFIPLLIIPTVVNGLMFKFWMFDGGNLVMPSILDNILMSAISIPFWLVGLCVGVSVWSWAYRYLVQGNPIVLPGEANHRDEISILD